MECRNCVHRTIDSIGEALAEAVRAQGVHIGSVTGDYTVEILHRDEELQTGLARVSLLMGVTLGEEHWRPGLVREEEADGTS